MQVFEKESGMRDAMRSAGLLDSVLAVSWLLFECKDLHNIVLLLPQCQQWSALLLPHKVA